ncbi:hypothetical protein [Flavobacterium granuli]|uniref:Outer membrane protein beta-barrel domain-containing protein n=1 Tax=Flavobacterium granuli TaxID=280093 RepID=A0ABU1S3S0_9FLAO|nr:hypothetical protein [Flavobacterium granuli]MDR6845666.1 hypothetical protein [Flavobacterium granuli]
MKTKFQLFFIFALFIKCIFIYSQDTSTQKNSVNVSIDSNQDSSSQIDSVKVSFDTNINFSAPSSNSTKEATAGIGTIGLKFERGLIYGDVNFTVYSQNKEIIAIDSSNTTIFGSNLLIPENSSNKISNFYIRLGTKSFYKNFGDNLPTFSKKRIGLNSSFRVNNTTWIKDTLSVPTTINSFELNVDYLLLNTVLFNTNEKIKLIMSFGLATRRLGGDYGLDKNTEIRNEFLGTEKLAFNGTNFGVRLEISKFYGEMNLTSFKRSQNIAGFSGNQSIISLGLRADLTLSGKEVYPKKNKTKEPKDPTATNKLKKEKLKKQIKLEKKELKDQKKIKKLEEELKKLKNEK